MAKSQISAASPWDSLEQTVQSLSEENWQLEHASRRFEELFQGLPIACFCYDTEGCIYEWNRACEVLFRRQAEQIFQCRVWDVVGDPKDKEIIEALVASVTKGSNYEGLECEAYAPDGTHSYLLCNMFPLRGADGVIVGGISANLDITERKRTEHALWESEERWQLALRGNNDGIWDWNVRTGQAFFSSRWKEMLGYEDDEIPNNREEWSQRIHPVDYEGVMQAFQEHLDRKAEFYNMEYRILYKGGGYKWVSDRGQALWDRVGNVLRVAGSFTDITERKRFEQQLQEANRKLETLATLDGLTGIKNRRAFQDRLQEEFARAVRYEKSLSLLILDVDFFKQYNDTYGHPAGDEVLKTVAQVLMEAIRTSDFVARYGGEEFVVILGDTNAAGALKVAERFRMAIENGAWGPRSVTASFGVATLSLKISHSEELTAAADKALYASKEKGRNCVTHYDDMQVDAVST